MTEYRGLDEEECFLFKLYTFLHIKFSLIYHLKVCHLYVKISRDNVSKLHFHTHSDYRFRIWLGARAFRLSPPII